MPDEQVQQPSSQGAGRSPGWYPVPGDMNAQSYWDGERWTARRRWNGGMWVEEAGETDGAGPPGAAMGRPMGPRTATATPTRNRRPASRRWVAVAVVVIVIAGAAAVVLALRSSGSSRPGSGPSAATSSSAPATHASVPAPAPATTAPTALAQTPSEAAVAACQADARSLEVALQAFQAQKGAYPSPPAAWSATTYASNYAPLVSSSGGGPYMRRPPATTQYVIEYDAAGHVWVAPPGAYEAGYNPGQSFDADPNICLAAVG